ncbi:glycosyltransferase family 2 protein [Paucibacter sp. APW11]|uniref:Glycosyltransferase family 2 protein n=1 Tax=Roseateles aquae TaxID=3077235 RepID=A0ABU3P7K0_9BURK|nr:glycosyltransferase family 2 protein [Paucibacter sp. APW11]MDT8998078.1 glycosyltransferase family 2 protein [Paucibacter sp. APW11]
MSAPWLSIILPVYGVESYVLDCAESILAQADNGVELIFVDDASPDGSAALIETLQARHPRLQLLRHERNLGLSGARNTGLSAASGDYVWCIDPDDLLEPGTLPRLRQLLAQQRPDLLTCDFRSFDDGGSTESRPRYAHIQTFTAPRPAYAEPREQLLGGLFAAGQFHAWTKIVRRAAWPDTLRFPLGRAFEDLCLVPRLALQMHSHLHVDEVWIAYRQRPGSILSTLNACKLDDWMAALVDFPADTAAAGLQLSARARFQIAHFCARSFVRICKRRAKLSEDGLLDALRRYGQQFRAGSPLAPQALLLAYLRRGRWLRALQLAWWLFKAR